MNRPPSRIDPRVVFDGVGRPVEPVPGGSVVVFDLDRTLIPGSSLVPFGRELVARRLVSGRVVGRHAARAIRYRAVGERADEASDLRARFLAVAAGRPHEPLAAAARQVGSRLGAELHATPRWLVDRHLDAGDFVVIVSASVHELVEAVAASIGVHRGIGTRAAVDDAGRLTGELRGPLCHGPGKLARLRDELGPVPLHEATAYSDSSNDLPLLSAVGQAVAVNPDRELAAVATRNGWPTVRYR